MNILDKLESTPADASVSQERSLLSIAISLKRIADAAERQSPPPAQGDEDGQ